MKKFLQNLIFQNKTSWGLGVLFLLLVWMPEQSLAQTKEYVKDQANGKNRATIFLGALSGGYNSTNGTTVANVENPGNAADGSETTYATMIAKNLSVLVADFSGEAWLQMNYSSQVIANTTTYIKIDEPTSTGFSLDVLELVGGLLGLLDENIIIPEVYNGPNRVSSPNVHSTMVRDSDGNIYLAVSSSEAYTGVRVKLRSQSNLLGLSLGGGVELNIYDAFHLTNAPTCGGPLYTYYEDSGLNIELLDFNNQHLNRAIDNDMNTYSLLKSGALLGVSVVGSMSQSFNFITESTETSTLNIKLALGAGGLINTDLLGSIQILLYDANNQVVYDQVLQSSLLNNTDVLTLLRTGAPATLTFAPGRKFARAKVKLNSTAGVNLLGNGVRVYDVRRYDGIETCANPEIAALPTPTSTPFETPSCASRLIDFDNVDFAQRAVDGNNESHATLYADSGNLLVSGPTAGFIEMDLGQTVPANKTTYVRINYDEDVLDRLVGGSLGKLVGDLANNLLLGNQYFEVEAKNGDTAVLTGTSSNAFEGTSNGAITMVQDNIGRYYIAITPNVTYNRIRITNNVVALLSTGKKAALDVYNACFELGTDSCLPANFTSYRGGGIGLNVGNISSVGVTNAYRAISENSSDYSEINLGIAGVLSNVYQTVYFSQPSKTGDKVKIRLAIEPSSPLSLDVLGRYQIKFFNGNVQVGGNETLQAGLLNNIDVLTLFNSGGIVELEYEPSGTFDRVDVGAESIASVNVAAEPLRVYSVERYGDTCPLTIGESPFMDPSCATELLAADNADNVQNLFDGNFDSYATLKSGAGVLFGINDLEGFVELGYNQPVSSGTTSYIRIDFDPGILESLVSGSLGNLVTGLLDNVLLGKHFFKVEVKDVNGNVIDEAASSGASASDAIRVVQDKEGRYYIAVTPTADYKSVRITDATNALLGVGSQPNTMNIYGMCHETSIADCMAPFATSYEFNGLNLSVNDLSGAGVTNAEFALNANSTQGSLISNGTLGIGTSTKQWIYFNKVSDVDEVVNISFKTQAGAIDLDLLGSLEIKAYLGNTEVTTLDWQNGLVNGVNVLNLLSNGEVVNLPFMPGAPFDRITVGIKTIVGVSVFPPVELLAVEPCTTINTKLLSNPNITNKLRK